MRISDTLYKKVGKSLLLFIFIFTTLIGHSQIPNTNLDSLFRVWNDENAQDSSRLKAIHKIAEEGLILLSNPDSALYYAQLEYDFAKSKGLKKNMADALLTQAYTFGMRSDYPKALDCHHQGLEIREELNDSIGIAATLLDIGDVYDNQGEYFMAMEYFQKSLSIYDEISDKKGIAEVLFRTGMLYDGQGYTSKALDHYLRVLKIYEEISDTEGIAKLLHTIGYVYHSQENYTKALEYAREAVRICEENDYNYFITFYLNHIGVIYINMEEYSMALDYYQRSLKISEEINDKQGIVRTLTDIGVIHYLQTDYSKAQEFYQRALMICDEVPLKKEKARIFNTIGSIYYSEAKYFKALVYFKRSLNISEKISNKPEIPGTLIGMGHIYKIQGDHEKSVDMYEKALQIAKEIGAIHIQQEVCKFLYETHKGVNNDSMALVYHEKMVILAESLNKEDIANELKQMEFAKKVLADSLQQVAEELEIQIAHENEVRKKERTRNIAYISGAFILLLAIALYSRLSLTRKAKARIEKEKDRSENLLLNILPAEIAAELKEKGEADARDFENVSVLFTDFIEFTQVSEKLSATELVAEINYCFKGFDAICEKYGIEKIKTIGDSYMAAGGLPVSKYNSVRKTVMAALEMAEFISIRKTERETSGFLPFEMRLGIHTGPVVAGIVGVKKFQYDIWGDTVNTASRMENGGEVGKVNISQSTYEFIKNNTRFTFSPRGEIETKGKGKVKMWFVEKVI